MRLRYHHDGGPGHYHVLDENDRHISKEEGDRLLVEGKADYGEPLPAEMLWIIRKFHNMPDYGDVVPDVPGNIQWYGRQRVDMPGGKWGTVYSESAQEWGLQVLYPRIYNGALHTSDEAWQHYKETGEHMGKFATIAEADHFAEKYHRDAEAGKYD